MFAICTDPSSLPDWQWIACYLTTETHFAFYRAFGVVLLLVALAAPLALGLGLLAALAAREGPGPLRMIARGYMALVRGIPDIVFFLFVPIALDQAIEWVMHHIRCPDWAEPIRHGNEFAVCPEARVPLANAAQWVHDAYGFGLAVIAFALVFGAFAANVLSGAMAAVPRAQVETAEAYGMSRAQALRRVVLPQMWVYALPGLSNLWMLLIKATPLLFLLGVRDIVYWAGELGAAKTRFYAYPHPDWRLWYYLALLAFYLALTWVSERVLARLTARLSGGQATVAGERLRRARDTRRDRARGRARGA